MIRRYGISFLFLFLAGYFAGSASLLQGQSAVPDASGNPVFKLNAQSVVVNVVVTDRDGKAVRGLKKEDFLVSEEGHPQKVTSFDEHAGTASAPVNLPQLPPNVFTNIPRVKMTDAVTVLLLDSLNTPITDQSNVRAEMRKYLKTPQPDRRMAIFTLGSRLRFLQGFTDDPSVLAATLNNLNRGSGPQTSDLLLTRADNSIQQTAVNQIATSDPTGGAQAAASAAALQQFFSEQNTSQSSLRVSMTIDAFQQLAHYLAGIPGRKNVVWFSSSFPLMIFPDPSLDNSFAGVNDFQQKVRKTDAMLAAAQVAIYPIAAEGTATDSHYDVETQMSAALTGQAAQEQQINTLRKDSEQRNGDHTAMEKVAEETGGKAIYNTNGLSEALSEVADAGSYFYALSYSPSNPASDGRYRKIEVKLSNGKYKLAYRRGYYAADAKSEQEAASKPPGDPLGAFMGPGVPDSTEISLAQRVQLATDQAGMQAAMPAGTPAGMPAGPQAPTPPGQVIPAGDNARMKGPLKRYAVDFLLTPHGVRLETSKDGAHHGRLEAALVVYDQGGHPVNWTEREIDLDMDATRYAEVLKSGINFRLEIDAPKEGIYLHSGVYDLASKLAGTLEISLSSVVGPVSTAVGGSK